MADLPDLPGLDSVEKQIDEGWPCCCCLPLPIIIIGGVVQGYWVYGLIVFAVMAGLAFALGRLSKRRIKTDDWELTETSFFRTVRIPWAEVTEAATITADSDESEGYIQVEAPGRRIRVPVGGPATAALEASVWQHLRRYGKEAHVGLSSDALSFWLPIPEDIPDELDWEMPRELDWAERARYSLRRRYILCELAEPEPNVKPTAVDFAAVTSARWEDFDNEPLSLVIESASDSVNVPLDPDDPACARFLLAVIRRLRTLDRIEPLVVPRRVRELARLRQEENRRPEG